MMENPSYSYDIQALSAACGLLRLDPNYLHGRHDSSNDDDDDDPLGRPEITVNINDDWTVSTEESRHSLEDDLGEDSAQSNEVNVDDNNLVASFYNNIRTLPSRRKSSSDDEDHVVPSVIPTKVSRLILDKELTLSDTEGEPDSEEEGVEVEEGEDEEEVEGATEKEEDVDTGVDLAKKTAYRYHDDEETRDRSNPQPP